MLLSRAPSIVQPASEDSPPPSVESVYATPEGIAVKFTRPMDPAGASNVRNYSVKAVSNTIRGSGAPSLGDFFGVHPSQPTPPSVKIRSARYDPSTQTATLIIGGKLNYRAWSYLLYPAKERGGARGLARLGPDLADLEGRPLDRSHDVFGRYSLGVTPPGSSPVPVAPQAYSGAPQPPPAAPRATPSARILAP